MMPRPPLTLKKYAAPAEVVSSVIIDEVCDADKRTDPMYRAMFNRLGLYIARVPEPATATATATATDATGEV